MQQDWERQFAFQRLDFVTISTLVAPACPDSAVLAAEPLTGGLANTLYSVTLTGRAAPVVLRIYQRGGDECRKEMEIERLVRGRVPVPRVLFADPAGTHLGHPYSVMEYAEGVKIGAPALGASPLPPGGEAAGGRHGVVVRSQGYAVGEALADIGAFTFERTGFFGPRLVIAEPFGAWPSVFLGEIERCLFNGPAAERLGADLAARLWAFARAHALALAAADGDPRLVHADYKASNLLLRREADGWYVSAVLDWEFALAATPLIDIGNLLRHEALLPTGFADDVARGYRARGGQLPAGWRRLARLLDLISLCQFLDMAVPRDAVINDARALIADTLRMWD